jgi:hypothetical protein
MVVSDRPSAKRWALRLTQVARAKIVFCTVFLSLENTVWDNVLALEAVNDSPIRPLPANRLFDCYQKRRDRFENRSAFKHRPARGTRADQHAQPQFWGPPHVQP